MCPKFEEERARELITMGKDIRTWEEDESPYQRVAEIFRDRGVRTGRVGIEERVRFFLFDGIRKAAPRLQFVSATPVTAGGRMFKSQAEIALMQKANDLTIIAYQSDCRKRARRHDARMSLPATVPQLFARWACRAESFAALASTLPSRTAVARRRN